MLAQSNQYERAARLYARVNELTPRTYEVLYNLGIALYNLDRNVEASKALSEAADLKPEPAETHFRLGLIASERADHANAVEEFKHAVERAPERAEYQLPARPRVLPRRLLGGRDCGVHRAAKIEPAQAQHYLSRADANYRKGESAAAAADFDRAAELDPKIENIGYWQGYTHRVAGDFETARRHLERFTAANPAHADALASLGFIAIEQGRFDEAEPPLRRALEIEPKNVPRSTTPRASRLQAARLRGGRRALRARRREAPRPTRRPTIKCPRAHASQAGGEGAGRARPSSSGWRVWRSRPRRSAWPTTRCGRSRCSASRRAETAGVPRRGARVCIEAAGRTPEGANRCFRKVKFSHKGK